LQLNDTGVGVVRVGNMWSVVSYCEVLLQACLTGSTFH